MGGLDDDVIASDCRRSMREQPHSAFKTYLDLEYHSSGEFANSGLVMQAYNVLRLIG